MCFLSSGDVGVVDQFRGTLADDHAGCHRIADRGPPALQFAAGRLPSRRFLQPGRIGTVLQISVADSIVFIVAAFAALESGAPG
jgi:hypothetical protein